MTSPLATVPSGTDWSGIAPDLQVALPGTMVPPPRSRAATTTARVSGEWVTAVIADQHGQAGQGRGEQRADGSGRSERPIPCREARHDQRPGRGSSTATGVGRAQAVPEPVDPLEDDDEEDVDELDEEDPDDEPGVDRLSLR